MNSYGEIYGTWRMPLLAFEQGDDISFYAARSIAEIITIHQDVNVDFEM